MTNAGRVSYVATLSFVCVGLIVTLTEFPFVTQDAYLYLGLRLFLLLALVPISFALKRAPFAFVPKIGLILSLSFYCSVGYYYRPMYLVGYTQLIFFFSFLYQTTRKEFLVLSTLFYTIFVATCYFTFESVPYDRGEETLIDIFVTPLGSNIIGLLVHHFFTAERRMQSTLHERFNSLGQMTSTIVHDLKGSLGAPLMIIGSVEDSLNKADISEAQKNLSSLKRNLLIIGDSVAKLNQLGNATSAQSQHQVFLFSEVLKDAQGILSKKLSHVEIVVVGDCDITGPKELFTSIVLNIFINSLEEFSRHHIVAGKITIEASKKLITFRDNGPGFKKDFVSKIKAGELHSDKETGTGLGLYLVRESLKYFVGRLELVDSRDGGVVRIVF